MTVVSDYTAPLSGSSSYAAGATGQAAFLTH